MAGILWMFATTLCFVTMNILVKYVGTGLPVTQAAFLRFALGVVFLVPMLGSVRKAVFTREVFGLIALRGGIHAIAMVLWFYAMTRIPIAEVTAMNFMNPIYVTLGAVVLFGEKIAAPRIIALIMAIIGGVVILRPGLREIDSGHIAMVFAAMFIAGSYLTASVLSKRLPASVVVFSLSIIVPLFLAPFAIAQWQTPTLTQLGLLFATSFFATFAHYCMTRAFACAPMSVIQPVSFLQLLWATIAGVALFGEGIDLFVICGGLMIIGAVTVISIREARAEKRLRSVKSIT
ncbi:DMT family transporter [Pacificibacter maritimus]|nr:DMT family transporter [Pacificibacter maritimus]